MEARRRVSSLTQAGTALSHTNSNATYAALSEEHYNQKRLDEQQAHHKRLLQQRLQQKKRGGGAGGRPNPNADPDHPDNVRKRQIERARQEKIAQKRLELKRREAHKRTQLRAMQRRTTQPETITVAKDGRIQQTRELTKEERVARLKARKEQHRREMREEIEANYNPFDPNSRAVKKEGDIWDIDDEADAMLQSADLLHEMSAATRAHGSPTRSRVDKGYDDEDMYAFDSGGGGGGGIPSLSNADSLGSFGDLLKDIDGVDTDAAQQAGRSKSRAVGAADRNSGRSGAGGAGGAGASSSASASSRPSSRPILRRPATSNSTAGSEGKGSTGDNIDGDELEDLLNDIL